MCIQAVVGGKLGGKRARARRPIAANSANWQGRAVIARQRGQARRANAASLLARPARGAYGFVSVTVASASASGQAGSAADWWRGADSQWNAGVRFFANWAQRSRAKAQQQFTERSSALGLAEMTHIGLFDLKKKYPEIINQPISNLFLIAFFYGFLWCYMKLRFRMSLNIKRCTYLVYFKSVSPQLFISKI